MPNITLKYAEKVSVDGQDSWQIHDTFSPKYCHVLETTHDNGDIELSVVESVLVFNVEKKAIITIGEYIKPSYRARFIVDENTGAFANQQIVVDENHFCSATDPMMQPIYDKDITHETITNEFDEEEWGDLKDGYITLWDAYCNNIGRQALFVPAQGAAYQRKAAKINS